jgi:hypothetical protein
MNHQLTDSFMVRWRMRRTPQGNLNGVQAPARRARVAAKPPELVDGSKMATLPPAP